MKGITPIRHDLVLVGGGHAHVEVLRRFGMKPLPGTRLTLVSPSAVTPYSGMLPGLIAGHYHHAEAHVELRPLCRFADAQFIQEPITGLDLVQRKVLFRDRPPLAFDTLSINSGSAPNLDSIPGARAHGLPVKPVEPFLEAWRPLHQRLIHGAFPRRPPRVVVVGGGAGGVELLFALRHRLLSDLAATTSTPPSPEFHLVSSAPVALPSHNAMVQRQVSRALTRQQIVLHPKCRVVEALTNELACEGGQRVPFDILIWAIHAGPPAWVARSGLATDDSGFIAVHSTLQSTSNPFVFAAGDVASVLDHPRPKSGVFAVRQGPPLAENLRRVTRGEAPVPFIPQTRALNLISTGDRHAIASYGSFALSGRWVWTMKDRIDRRWMRRYQHLPTMAKPGDEPSTPRPDAYAPHSLPHRPCGGCAAKVPAEVLARVLTRLQLRSRPEILIGLEAPDDASAFVPPPGLALVQTADFFRTFVADPHLLGRIATLHALNDLFAMGACPHSALAIATVPFGSPAAVEETLFQVLSGASAVLEAHDTVLIGGHSAEGSELSFGLTLNGFVPPEHLLRKGGLKPGDELVLTKPLGTGTLFAADMTGLASGAWISHALRTMLMSGAPAADCLRRHGATACTDVSGFGLLGHLLEMLRASTASATLDLDALPALDGALETSRRGLLSSLHPQNLRARAALAEAGSSMETHERFALLFDPQTSGGLLAGIPAPNVSACLADLRAAGFDAARVVGRVETHDPSKPRVKGKTLAVPRPTPTHSPAARA